MAMSAGDVKQAGLIQGEVLRAYFAIDKTALPHAGQIMEEDEMDRADKLAEALRANLRRRKQQARTRARPEDEPPPPRSCSTPPAKD